MNMQYYAVQVYVRVLQYITINLRRFDGKSLHLMF